MLQTTRGLRYHQGFVDATEEKVETDRSSTLCMPFLHTSVLIYSLLQGAIRRAPGTRAPLNNTEVVVDPNTETSALLEEAEAAEKATF